MIKTRFSEEELTQICQIMKKHGTDCATLVDVLRVARRTSPNDGLETFKHVRLMKEFGIIGDRDLLCHTCVIGAIQAHDDACEDHKKSIASDYPFPCPDDHYNWASCEPAVWLVDGGKIHRLARKAAKKALVAGNKDDLWIDNEDGPHFTHTAMEKWLQKTFPDVESEIRWNPAMGLLCDKHIGSMREYSDKITGYENEDKKDGKIGE